MCPIRPGNLAIVLLALGAGPAPGSAAQPPNGTWLTLARVGQYGRAPIHTDALEIEIVAGTWTTPQPGDEVRVDAETLRIWQPATPDAEGWLRDPALRGGYACWLVERDTPGVMLLEARGHGIVYVNGAPHAGDPYDTGWLQTPVQLNAGANTLLFLVGRGQLRAELVEPPAPLMLSTRDTTLPDIIRGEGEVVWAALPVLNATSRSRSSCPTAGDTPQRWTGLPP